MQHSGRMCCPQLGIGPAVAWNCYFYLVGAAAGRMSDEDPKS